MSDFVSDTAVTEPKVPVAGTEGPHAEDQRDERLPWRRLAKYAGIAAGAFALAGLAAITLQWNGLGGLRDDRDIATKQVHAEQIGIVEPRLIERETRAAELTAQRRRQLGEWSWVDREKNLVRMPIERAMQQIAAEARPLSPRRGEARGEGAVER
jgi:hypothetical protein